MLDQIFSYLRSSVPGGQVVAEINSSGVWTRGYVYLGGQLLAIQYGSAVSTVHQEPVTKSQRITNSSGTIVSYVDLDPWGGETWRSSPDMSGLSSRTATRLTNAMRMAATMR
ncbi:MAG: hypothetical protein ACR2LM_07795 [Pyrinomonadaceae bacterium]